MLIQLHFPIRLASSASNAPRELCAVRAPLCSMLPPRRPPVPAVLPSVPLYVRPSHHLFCSFPFPFPLPLLPPSLPLGLRSRQRDHRSMF